MNNKLIKKILKDGLEYPDNNSFNSEIIKNINKKANKDQWHLFNEKTILQWFLCIAFLITLFYFPSVPKINPNAVLVISLFSAMPIYLLIFNKIHSLQKTKKMKNSKIAIAVFIGLTAFMGHLSAQTSFTTNVKNIEKQIETTELGNNYNGSVLIADGKQVLFQKSYGNDQNSIKNQLATKYDIASMGKMFTAIAIMQLQESKKLQLQHTIGDILHDYPNEDAKKITLEQLLSHTSGLGDFFSPNFDQNKGNIKTLTDYLPFFVNDPLEFNPGERMRYSNAGYIVLGLIIEKVSRTDYNSYIKNNIFDPTGLSRDVLLSSSAGGGKLSVTELHKFALAFKSQKLTTKESFTAMTTDHFKNGYGYGMSLRDLNGIKVYGHNGGAPGVSGELDMVFGSDLIIVTLSNRSPMDGWAQLRNSIRKEFFGSTPEIEEFLNTEKVVNTYKKYGFKKASELLTQLDNNISDRNIFRFAEKYAGEGTPEKAIDILKLIVQAYSDQWYPYSFLADFQLQAGQKEAAIKNYKISLELNPKNEQAIEQLKKLGV